MTVENKKNSKTKEIVPAAKIDYQIIAFVSQQEFESWQEKNHSLVNGLWIRIFKKDSGVASITYDEALDVALCYGWIDGQLKKYDENSYIQKFTPRRSKSMWSKRNVEKVALLEKEGRIKPSGRKQIESAIADGRYLSAYDSPGNMVIPEDFIQQISKNKKAYDFFKTLDKTNLYSIGWKLQTAVSPASRHKRIIAIIEKLEKEEKFH